MGTKKIRAEYDNMETTDVRKKADQLGLTSKDLIWFYETMVEIRHFKEMATTLYGLGKVHGTMHLSIGQESLAVGECYHLGVSDFIFGSHRSHGEIIAKCLSAITKLEEKQ